MSVLISTMKVSLGGPMRIFLAGLTMWVCTLSGLLGQQTEQGQNDFVIEAGTHVPLSFINSVSTKNAAEGDRIYLETAFPILSGGKIVIPVGSHVAGTVTQVKKPGRMRGRGELYIRFDTLILPNGVTRDFRARIGAIDGRSRDELDRAEGKIRSEGGKGSDAMVIAGTAATGASIGAIAGAAAKAPMTGTLVGAAAGAAAGMIGVLLTRGPDAILSRGSTVEMVIDRPLQYTPDELEFGQPAPRRGIGDTGELPSQQKNRNAPGRRNPLGGVL